MRRIRRNQRKEGKGKEFINLKKNDWDGKEKEDTWMIRKRRKWKEEEVTAKKEEDEEERRKTRRRGKEEVLLQLPNKILTPHPLRSFFFS